MAGFHRWKISVLPAVHLIEKTVNYSNVKIFKVIMANWRENSEKGEKKVINFVSKLIKKVQIEKFSLISRIFKILYFFNGFFSLEYLQEFFKSKTHPFGLGFISRQKWTIIWFWTNQNGCWVWMNYVLKNEQLFIELSWARLLSGIRRCNFVL